MIRTRPWSRAMGAACIAVALCASAAIEASAADTPRLVVQTGQSNVRVAAWSPDGRLVASGGTDGRVVLWDAATGRELHALGGEDETLTSLRFDSDGRTLMAGTAAGRIRSWDVATGAPQAGAQFGTSPVRALDSADAGRVLMVAVESGQVVVAGTRDTPVLIDLAPYSLTTAALSPDRSTVAVAKSSPDESIVLFDARTGERGRELKGHRGMLNALRFSPDGRMLAAGGDDRVIRMWDMATGRLVRSIDAHGYAVESLDFSPDGRTLASSGVVMRLWDVATGAPRGTALRPSQYQVQAVFAPDGERMLAIDQNGMEIWSLATGTKQRELRRVAVDVEHVAFSPDGTTLRIDDVTWDLASGTASVGTAISSGYLRWSRDGTRALAERAWGPVLYDVGTGAETRVPIPDEGVAPVLDSALSPDGQRVAMACGDGTVRLWDPRRPGASRTLLANDYAVRHVAFSPDGQWLAAGGRDRPVTLWRLRDLHRMYETPGDAPWAFGFTPDSRGLALAGGDGRVTLHALEGAGADRVVAEHGAPVRVLRYSPDGRWLATGGGDHRIRLWDAATGAPARTLEGHDDRIVDLAFSPDGGRLASTSADATTRLWSVVDGHALATLVRLRNAQGWTSDGVVVAPDGRFDAPDLEGLQGLHWILPAAPLRPVPLEAFMRDYYEPRLLPRLLSGEALPPVAPITTVDTRVPEVRIVSVAADPAAADRVQVDVEVRGAPAVAARELRLFRDGQLVGSADGDVRAREADGVVHRRFSVRLPSDDRRGVTFSAYAFNTDRVKSETAYRLHVRDDLPRPGPRRAILVTIGVDVYESPAWDLAFAASDARLIGTALEARLRALDAFDEVVRIEVVSDADTPDAATKAAIHDALVGLGRGVGKDARPVGPDDVVIVSFSGHGAIDREGAFYLLPHDVGDVASRLVTPAVLAHGIRDDELGAWLRDIDAGEMVLLLDACHSAASVAQPGFKPGPMGSRGLGQLAYDKGLRILAATQPDDVALESDATQHGLLSYALVKDGLEQGRADFRPVDRRITLAEWLGYGLERVPMLAAEVQAGTVGARGAASPRVRGTADAIAAPAARGLQRPALFDFRRAPRDVEIATP